MATPISPLDAVVIAPTTQEKPLIAPTAVKPSTSPTDTTSRHPLDAFVPGYPKIAARMGLVPETGMFRRSGALNARNLLYLQSDLARIEKDLIKLEWEDSESNTGRKKYYSQDSRFINSATESRDGDVRQCELVMRMRETLHLYNHALIQQCTILKMEEPDPVDIRNMQSFYDGASMNLGDTLIGPDRDIWGTICKNESHSKELVVLKPREGKDTFSRKLSSFAIPLYKAFACARFQKPNSRFGAMTVREDRVFKITLWTTSIVASMMPVLSIVILSNLKELNARLAAIAGFNALLSICLLWFTDAKRTDIFAVTAAFAAIQVVFVGQALDEWPKEVVVTNTDLMRAMCVQ